MRSATARLAAILLATLDVRAQAPRSPDAFIAARQGELTQYGKMLLHVDFNDGRWTHRTLAVCPAFTHHAFALYERTLPSGTDRILITYNLDTPPARDRDRPWQGGIVGLALGAEWGTAAGHRPDEIDLVRVFNRVLADEQRATPAASRSGANFQGSYDEVVCFAALAGEQLLPPAPDSGRPALEPGHSLSGLVAPVASNSPGKRFQAVEFDPHGSIEYARVEYEATARN